MRAVIDTNVFLSALINHEGAPAKIRQRWLDGQFTLVTSEPVENEYTDVLLHAPMVQTEDVQVMLEEIQTSSTVVAIDGTLQVCRDSDDDVFLETAVVGGADFFGHQEPQTFPQEILRRCQNREGVEVPS